MEHGAFTLINNAEIAHPDWRFLENTPGAPRAEWTFCLQNPENPLERLIRKPKIARYRASIQAALHARRCTRPVLISHLPRTTAWTAQFARLARVTAPHLAFSFNFTDLPQGRQRAFMAKAFQSVDRFVVYSTFERSQYADWFGLDPDRIDVVHWAMAQPAVSDTPRFQSPYICAVGGEGRDYGLLVEAMKKLPQIKLVIVAREHNLRGLDLPENVHALTDLPATDYWNIVANSEFVVIPLENGKKANGHISIVGAYLLGKTVVATDSRGTEDYLHHGRNCLTVPPSSLDALTTSIQRLSENTALRAQLSATAREFADTHCQPSSWNRYLSNYLVGLEAR